MAQSTAARRHVGHGGCDLDRLLRSYRWEPGYWHSRRTTNAIEQIDKEVKRRSKAMKITAGKTTTS